MLWHQVMLACSLFAVFYAIILIMIGYNDCRIKIMIDGGNVFVKSKEIQLCPLRVIVGVWYVDEFDSYIYTQLHQHDSEHGLHFATLQ